MNPRRVDWEPRSHQVPGHQQVASGRLSTTRRIPGVEKGPANFHAKLHCSLESGPQIHKVQLNTPSKTIQENLLLMNNSVYHIQLTQDQLPGDGPEKAQAARHIAAYLTGQNQGYLQYLQGSTEHDGLRLTISVPEDLEDVHQRLGQMDINPQGTEPSQPTATADTATLPGSYIIMKKGHQIHPRQIESNPSKLHALAAMLAEADLPQRFQNPDTWEAIAQDDETGTIHVAIAA